MAELPETESFRAFAARLGCKPGYVTELRKAGRLVLTADRRCVRVAESLRLIEDTRDPAKLGVRARHAAARGQGAPVPPAGAGGDDEGAGAAAAAAGDVPDAADPLSRRRAKAQAEREEAMLRKALRDEQVEMGGLLVKDEVLSALGDAVVQLRSRLELLPAVLSPQLAASDDEDEIRMKLRDGIEQAFAELARKFTGMGKAEA